MREGGRERGGRGEEGDGKKRSKILHTDNKWDRKLPEKENRGMVLGFPASILCSSISTPPSSSFLSPFLSPSSSFSFSPSSWTGVGREVETELENEAVDSVTEAVLELMEKDGVAADDDGQLAPSSDFSADIFRAEGKHFCSSIH